MPVRDVEGLFGQDEMAWEVEDGIGVVEYMKVLTGDSEISRHFVI